MRWMVARNVKCAPDIVFQGVSAVLSAADRTVIADFIQHYRSNLRNLQLLARQNVVRMWIESLASSMCALRSLAVHSIGGLELNAVDSAAMNMVLTNSVKTLAELRMQPSVVLTPLLGQLTYPSLRVVEFSGITDADLASVCRLAPNLHEMILRDKQCSGAGLSVVGQYCHELRRLHISNHPFDDVYGNEIDEAAPAIASGCSKLQRIGFESCKGMTDAGLTSITTHCTQLKELYVLENDNITDAPLVALANHDSASLHTLRLCYCAQIAGSGVQAVAQNCPNLHTVELRGLDAEQMQGTTGAISCLHNAKFLDLSQCDGVNDNVLALIAEHMHMLQKLRICADEEGEFLCTVNGIELVLGACEQLNDLSLGDTKGVVSAQQKADWRQVHPGLKV